MKIPFLFLAVVLGTSFFTAGCSAKPVKPRQLFASVGSDPIGGPMRVGQDRTSLRNPPKLPNIIVDVPTDELASTEVQPPPPPIDNTSVTAAPTITSPVPTEADAFFEGQPVQTSALGALFQSIFQPANPQPTATGSATYRVVP